MDYYLNVSVISSWACWQSEIKSIGSIKKYYSAASQRNEM